MLPTALSAMPSVVAMASSNELHELAEPAGYLGEAEVMINSP
tara:strand:+ start:4205 stop:4330 length:126 start_codon:yes stop_codon:yes gene_type:complete